MRTVTAVACSLAGATLALTAPLAAQQADPADVGSLDAVVAAVYDVISGPAGQERDWDRFRSLFVDGARLIPVGRPQDGGPPRTSVLSPDHYIAASGPFLVRNGFFEREIGRVTERYGHMAHLFSSYESRRSEADPEPFARGINSFQLMHDGTRWWIVTIFWQGESAEFPIPERYLRGG